MKALLNAIETAIKASLTFGYLNDQVTCAVNGLMSPNYVQHAIVLSPRKSDPRNYPASYPNHTELTVVVYCYAEFYGERVGLMGSDDFKGVLDMEQDVREFLTPNGNADFLSFDGIVSSCLWAGSVYPESRFRNYENWNEVQISFLYRN